MVLEYAGPRITTDNVFNELAVAMNASSNGVDRRFELLLVVSVLISAIAKEERQCGHEDVVWLTLDEFSHCWIHERWHSVPQHIKHIEGLCSLYRFLVFGTVL